MGTKPLLIHDQGCGPSAAAALEHPRPAEVLKELFLLLEEFGPQWYTEELHDRAVAALHARMN